MTSPTPAGLTETTSPPDNQAVEAINQVFALFRLNYHNQYYAAWSDAEQVKQVKRLWLDALDAYPTAVILRAAQHAIENSDYLPTLNRMIDACHHALSDLGLPSPYDAYREACLAPSPKVEASWQHPAVYLAGRDSNWFFLANEPEAKTWPVFREHYERWVSRAARGETLKGPERVSISPPEETVPSPEEQATHLARLRKEIGL
jgi:uncharacterized protein YjiS (DUF1127 family)